MASKTLVVHLGPHTLYSGYLASYASLMPSNDIVSVGGQTHGLSGTARDVNRLDQEHLEDPTEEGCHSLLKVEHSNNISKVHARPFQYLPPPK